MVTQLRKEIIIGVKVLVLSYKQFTNHVYNKPYWRVPTGLLLIGLGFLYNFDTSLPEEIASISRRTEENRLLDNDTEKHLEQSKAVAQASLKLKAIVESAQETIVGRLSAEKIENVIDEIGSIKTHLKFLQYQFKGYTYRSSEASLYAEQLESLINSISIMLEQIAIIENQLEYSLKSDVDEPSKDVKVLIEQMYKTAEEIARTESQRVAMESLLTKLEIDSRVSYEKEWLLWRNFMIKGATILLAIFYVGACVYGLMKRMVRNYRRIFRISASLTQKEITPDNPQSNYRSPPEPDAPR